MNRKLPVWQIFTRALSLVWEKRGFAAAVGWPVVLLSGLWGLGVDAGYVPSPLDTPATRAGAVVPKEILVPLLAYLLAQSFLLTMVAVYWHRSILLQEDRSPLLPFRADGVVWRYIGYAILALLVVTVIVTLGSTVFGLAMALLGTLSGLSPAGASTTTVFGLLLIVPILAVSFLLLFRFSLALPAAAIGHRGFGLRSAWRATRQNNWRILGLQVLAMLFGFSVGVLEYGTIEAMKAAFGAPPHWFRLGANAAANLAYVLLGIGILSLTYAYLTHDMPQEDARMEA